MEFKCVEEQCPFAFQERVNNLIKEGYCITDTYCNVVGSLMKYVCFLFREPVEKT